MSSLAVYISDHLARALLIGWVAIAVLVGLLASLVMASPAYAQSAPAVTEAGVIVSAAGDTSLSRRGHISTPAKQAQKVFSGDKLRTGSNGRINLRFSDGMQMNIGSASQLKIDQYAHGGKKERSWFDLLRGSLRTVTGMMGKREPKSFRLRTPTAVVGIRGTDFKVMQRDCSVSDCQRADIDAMEVSVISGAVDVVTSGGQLAVGAGQTAKIGQAGAVPKIARAPRSRAPRPAARALPPPSRLSAPPVQRSAAPSTPPNASRSSNRALNRMPIDPSGASEFLAPSPR